MKHFITGTGMQCNIFSLFFAGPVSLNIFECKQLRGQIQVIRSNTLRCYSQSHNNFLVHLTLGT